MVRNVRVSATGDPPSISATMRPTLGRLGLGVVERPVLIARPEVDRQPRRSPRDDDDI